MKNKKGTLIVISAPSGGGKTTVIEHLLKKVPNSSKLITTTSRLPRENEKDGVDYNFLTKQDFEDRIKNDDFVEYVEYAGFYYGVERSELNSALDKHQYLFAAVEVRGKKALSKENVPIFSIFLLPESLGVLRSRLSIRDNMTKKSIDQRLEVAKREIKASKQYDAQIINKQGFFQETVDQIIELLPKS